MVKLAVIWSAIFKIVSTRAMSVLANFQGSVSAKYLLPSRAKFMASDCASRNLYLRINPSIFQDTLLIDQVRLDLPP